MDYKYKYLKYKSKYLDLKNLSGGMDHDNDKKSSESENCEICSIELNNESNQCTNPRAFKKVLDDGKVVCIACCEALDFAEDSKPSAQVEKKPTVAPTKLVEIQSNIKCSNCGNSYSTTLSHCDNCGFINPLFRKPNKKKKKKKKKN